MNWDELEKKRTKKGKGKKTCTKWLVLVNFVKLPASTLTVEPFFRRRIEWSRFYSRRTVIVLWCYLTKHLTPWTYKGRGGGYHPFSFFFSLFWKFSKKGIYSMILKLTVAVYSSLTIFKFSIAYPLLFKLPWQPRDPARRFSQIPTFLW